MDTTPQEKARTELARRELIRRGAPTDQVGAIVEALPDAAKNAFAKLTSGVGSTAKDLGTNPVTMAKVLPYATQGAASFLGGPMAGTRGYAGGRILSDLALTALGQEKQIPPINRQLMEGAGAVAGDVLPLVPALNRKVYGGDIAAAEKAGNVPPAQDIPSIPMALGQKTVGEFINDTMDSVKAAAGRGNPVFWKQIKDQIDRIYQLGKDQGLTGLDRGRLEFLNSAVQSGLNTAVPGRGLPAGLLANSQVVPNAIQKTYQSLSPAVRTGLGFGTGTSAAGGLAYSLYKALGGKNQ